MNRNNHFTIPEAKLEIKNQLQLGFDPKKILDSIDSIGVISAKNNDNLISRRTIETLITGIKNGRMDIDSNTSRPLRSIRRKSKRKKDSELQDFAREIGFIIEFGTLTSDQKITEIRNVLDRI